MYFGCATNLISKRKVEVGFLPYIIPNLLKVDSRQAKVYQMLVLKKVLNNWNGFKFSKYNPNPFKKDNNSAIHS